MVLTLPSAAAKALPVTLKEFRESLSSTWSHHVQGTRRPTTLGLAISGGVDSMALASLCAKVQSSGSSDWRFRAFVVDHGARAGSSDEAQAVANLVNKKGIDTKVLKIEWPKGLIPSKSSKFESLARHYRFRILGEACRDSNIRNLLLAHHEDDHFETILMRLATGHHSRGLLGMRPSGRIPECYGIYGVYDSGATVKDFGSVPLLAPGILKEQGKLLIFEDSTGIHKTHKQNEPMKDVVDDLQAREAMRAKIRATRHQRRLGLTPLDRMQLEDGGIKVVRPLLQYSKERLIVTCLQDGTSWFEDHTNADPTLTPRNAIRHIYKEHSLPLALQKDAIIALSKSMQQRKDSLEREALALLGHCAIRDFEPRAGSLFVRFPKLTSSKGNPACGKDKTGAGHTQREVACRLLKYTIEAVTPYEHRQYPLGQACNTVFPELNTARDQAEVYPNKFTVAGVMFQRNELNTSLPIEDEDAISKLGSDQEPHHHRAAVPMQDYEWFLSRQPHESILQRQPMLEYPPLTSFKGKNDGWKFYDGRYWIRVLNHTPTTIKVRPLRKRDLPAFKELEFVRHRLQTIARGDVRFTLPVIVMAAAEPGEKEKVLALPTLDIVVDGAKKLMDYEIRYKKVEWPRFQETG